MATNGLSAGKKVSVARGGIHIGEGKVHSNVQRANGTWYGVNFAAPRKPADVRFYRASNLTRI